MLPCASVTVMLTWDVPAAVGVPLNAPAAESDTPAGRPEALHVNAPIPPVAAILDAA